MQINTSRFSLSIEDSKRTKTLTYKKEAKELLCALAQVISVCDRFLFSTKGPIALDKLRIEFVELRLVLCGTNKIKNLNRDYRGIDKVTDVLSFPVHEELRKGQRGPLLPGPIAFGDIYICREVAERQAANFAISYRHEVIHLFIHGFLHLLGFDHEISQKEEDIMFSYEDKLVKSIYNKLNSIKVSHARIS